MNKSYSVIITTLLISPSTAKEGNDVTLRCSTTLNPTVTRYAFFRGDVKIESGVKDTYTFQAKKGQSLDYKCSATNSVGMKKESSTQKLDLQCNLIIILLVRTKIISREI